MTWQPIQATPWPGSAVAPSNFAAPEASEVTLQVFRESRRTAATLNAAPQEVPAQLRVSPSTGRRITLPPVLTDSYPLQAAMRARAAVRFYDAAPVTLAQLGTICQTTLAGDRQNWPQEEAAGVGLQLKVVAWRVAELEPAIWQYEADTHELSYVGRAPRDEESESLALQHEFSAAPMLVFITGNLAAACARYGSWGHRQMLLRAGAAGQRLWLSALGVGLVGTVFAGFVPRAAQRFAGVDGYLQASLLAFAAGRPPWFAQPPAAS